MQVARGVKSVLLPRDRFDADEAWRLVARWRITNMFTVPTIVKMLTEHPSVDAHDHSSLRYVIYAGAPMYREDQKHALRKLGKVLVQYFGLGEVTGNITVLPPALHETEDAPGVKVGTCGYERTAMQVSIQDEQGEELAAGETGEICVCGPAVFAGYYNNPEANAKAFRDGWFLTGDLGHVDEEGFLYITGRASDMYISGGSNVYPRETEEKILTHPAIAEVAILGVPDKTWGEVGVAVCVLRQEAALNERELLAWLEGKVSRYKLPKRVFFWDALPKSGYGKITKKDVREALAARGCLPLGQAGRGFGLRYQPSDLRGASSVTRSGGRSLTRIWRKSCLIDRSFWSPAVPRASDLPSSRRYSPRAGAQSWRIWIKPASTAVAMFWEHPTDR